MVSNNSKKSTYSSELEEYMDEQGILESDSNFDESPFQTSNIKSRRLDEYLGPDDEKEDEEINYCSICGKELKKYNYGDKCDDCVKKVELVNDLNQLLDYTAPSEKLNREILLRAGFEELKLNIIISNLLNENLIILGSKGIFLADVKTLNNFFRIYGSSNDLLDESLYKNLMFSEGFVDISEYSDLVQIMFNSKRDKWEVNLYRDGKPIIKKFFAGILDANNFATRYLKEMGELDNIYDKTPIQSEGVKYKKSKHKFVFFSVNRNRWYVRVKSPIGSKFVGFYRTEDEAVIARDNYIKKQKETREKIKPKKFVKDESDAIISFHERSEQWVVKVKRKQGGFKKLGYFDTEEEAIAAKNDYYGIENEQEEDSDLAFREGDRVQLISGPLKGHTGVIQGFFEERDSFIVKFETIDFTRPIFVKEEELKLI